MLAVYIRVSTSKQETAAQRKAIADYCRSKGYVGADVREYVDDGVSGKTLERPEFRRLMQDVKAGKVRRIVTFELSRLSRDFLDLLEVMRTLTKFGVVVEVPGEGAVAFDSTMERFIVAARSLVADQERERISERTKAGLAAARARGERLGAPEGNTNRLGFRKDYTADGSALVDELVELRGEGKSFRAIAARLNKRGQKISAKTVRRILERHTAPST